MKLSFLLSACLFLFVSLRKVKVEKVVIRAFTTLVRSSKEIKLLR